MGGRRQYWLIGTVCLVFVFSSFIGYRYYAKMKLFDELNAELESDIIFGEYDAPKNLILYFDYNCGYCKKFFKEVYPELEKSYIRSGQVKLTLRLICSGNDENALRASQTAICINKFGDFEKLHSLLLHKSEIVYSSQFQGLIEDYILASEEVGNCILNSDNQDVIRNIFQFQLLKTKGTPTFVLDNEAVAGLRDYNFWKGKLK